MSRIAFKKTGVLMPLLIDNASQILRFEYAYYYSFNVLTKLTVCLVKNFFNYGHKDAKFHIFVINGVILKKRRRPYIPVANIMLYKN